MYVTCAYRTAGAVGVRSVVGHGLAVVGCIAGARSGRCGRRCKQITTPIIQSKHTHIERVEMAIIAVV